MSSERILRSQLCGPQKSPKKYAIFLKFSAVYFKSQPVFSPNTEKKKISDKHKLTLRKVRAEKTSVLILVVSPVKSRTA